MKALPMARPRKVIDPEMVRKLASIHCTVTEIALVLGCSIDTLERRFRSEINSGKAEGRMRLRKQQWELASKGNAVMQIWLGKQYLGQEDKQVVDSVNVNYEQKRATVKVEIKDRIKLLKGEK